MIDDPAEKKPDDWVEEKRIVDSEAKKPEYEDDDAVYSYPDFGFIGFDLWQVNSGSIFDNIIITDEVSEADKFSAKWKALNEKEKEEQKKEDEAKKADDKKDDKKDDDDDDDDDDDEKKEE